MYVTRIPNRGSPPAILLRESYRENGRVKSRTIANLSHWPAKKIESFERALKGLGPGAAVEGAFEISRSLPHGHVAAVLGTLRSLGIEELLDEAPSRYRDLVTAMITARVVGPCSKLATARGLRTATCSTSLGEVCGVSGCDEDDLYAAMDWVIERQEAIEQRLATRHLKQGMLVLYDVSSAAFEGCTCPLGAIGYARDGVKGRRQVVYGVLTTTEGIPVAIEAFQGNTVDPATLSAQVQKVKQRFDLSHVVLVGDRGMITKARITEELAPAGLDWITALRAPAIKALVKQGWIQLSLFDEHDLVEIRHPEYEGDRLIICRNPVLGADRRRTREELLAATERELEKVVAATKRARAPLRGKDRIAMRVVRGLDRYKVGKHFQYTIDEDSFTYHRNEVAIAQEAALDGLYVLRTSVPGGELAAEDVVSTYKRLDSVERVFRGFNSALDLRPIHHRRADRVRAHPLLCMLGYYVMWHMEDRLAPLLFKDHDRAAGEAGRSSPVAPAVRSQAATSKARTKRTEAGEPVHSLQSLLADLGTVAVNTIQPATGSSFRLITTPTAVQSRAFELLGVSPHLGYP